MPSLLHYHVESNIPIYFHGPNSPLSRGRMAQFHIFLIETNANVTADSHEVPPLKSPERLETICNVGNKTLLFIGALESRNIWKKNI